MNILLLLYKDAFYESFYKYFSIFEYLLLDITLGGIGATDSILPVLKNLI